MEIEPFNDFRQLPAASALAQACPPAGKGGAVGLEI